MKKRKKRKSSLIPKYNTIERNIAVKVLKFTPTYEENRKKGLPFFSAEELKQIREKYPDGMTWEEIDSELTKKGLMVKKATFRKYIQEGLISSAKGYKKTKNGRVAIYPNDTIEHINFIQYYYRVENDDFIEILFSNIAKEKITLSEALIEYDQWIDPPFAEMLNWITGRGGGNLAEALEKILKNQPEKLNNFFSDLKKLADKFNADIRPELERLNDWLESETISRGELMKIKEVVPNEDA